MIDNIITSLKMSNTTDTMESRLRSKYPDLFRPIEGVTPLDQRGIECWEGWESILDELFGKLSQLDVKPRLAQVKQKFATLTVYLDQYSKETQQLLATAAVQSARTCEVCGQPGQRKGSYYILTLCDPCNQQRENRQDRWAW